MSWEQNYKIERLIDFAYKFYGDSYDKFLEDVFEKVIGKKIIKVENIILVDDPWYNDETGRKITFADGTTYIHKLIERYTSHGNYGCDTYELIRENIKVKVKEINEDGGEIKWQD